MSSSNCIRTYIVLMLVCKIKEIMKIALHKFCHSFSLAVEKVPECSLRSLSFVGVISLTFSSGEVSAC